MFEEITLILGISGILISVIGLLVQHFKSIVTIQTRLTAIETKLDLFWKAVEKNIAEMLKSPHTLELDSLLSKFQKGKMSRTERERLKKLLHQKKRSKDSGKRLAVILVLARLETWSPKPRRQNRR